MLSRADVPGLARVEQHDVGVGSDGDRSLFRKQAEQLRRRGRGQLDELLSDMPCFRTPPSWINGNQVSMPGAPVGIR